MPDSTPPFVAIVDYGVGNLLSVKQACQHVGLGAEIVSSPAGVLAAEGVILPGIGAFGDAIARLRELDLVNPLLAFARSGKPLVGICLGMQLLMSESSEFGRHAGLGLLEGNVVRFAQPRDAAAPMKVPQVGWNGIGRPSVGLVDPWSGSPLDGLDNGSLVYFVHSFYVKPVDETVVLATSVYGGIEFCSAVRRRNVIGFQFHPERSGVIGLRIYRNIATTLRRELGLRSLE